MRCSISDNPRRILLRLPNWVGDLVMCTPALRSIRHRYPSAHISAIVKPSLTSIIKNSPFIDQIIEYEPKGRDQGIYRYIRFIMTLRKQHFDIGIAFTSSFSSAQLLFLAGIPIRVGYDRNLRGWMLTHRKMPLRNHGRIVPMNKVDLDLGLCELLGCTDLNPRPELYPGPQAIDEADRLLQRHGIKPHDIFIVIIPGATYGPSKCWKREYFAQVADALIDEYDAKIIFAAGPGELPIVQDIIRFMNHRPIGIDDTVLPLDTLMALVQRCTIMITNDTGPRHFAVAFDKPVVVIMGSTDPRHTDCNLEKSVVLQEQVPCGPCHLRRCPIDHRCMALITPDRVLAAARKMIEDYYNFPGRS
ncbi:MAG: lipopolysaccharide heptosyltransferase II [Desulfobacterota bacterium]|nr:lipopolysaccharide heptosyltransferase II [Thermodesulfobacteriota bacterium]